MPRDEDFEPNIPEDLGEHLAGSWKPPRDYADEVELQEKVLKGWGRVADKMREAGDTFGKMADALSASMRAVEAVGEAFDDLEPILAKLEEGAGDEPEGETT